MKKIVIQTNDPYGENGTENDRKFVVFCTNLFTFSFIAHVLLMPVFSFFGNPLILTLDLSAAALDLFCLTLNRKRYVRIASFLWVLELSVLSSSCVLVFGWQQGHYYYLFSLVPIVFFARWPGALRIAVALFLFGDTLFLYDYTQTHSPVTPLIPYMATSMYLINVAINFIGLGYASYFYRAHSEQLERQLLRKANTDGLTGIHNRRSFECRAQVQLVQTDHQDECALIYFDLDHFKRINDSYGHAAGDRALKMVAEACRHVLRKEDLFARIGGEEFAVFLANTSRNEAISIAERLRKQIESCCLTFQDGKRFFLSASIGLAAPQLNEKRLDLLMANSDLALYQAKRDGRNRVVSFI
ncbi:GGDEF domain-containing protein [Sporolactobacillus terrae]|uniref:Cellulose biosynthesis regulator YedQ n=1 Tax=Sporolactobacillus terrae TaxID=269673 RepID=A0ABX5Q9K6_9BACL|nr:GGDEF domain-containing protein [Sporolactobacillus terrae]QAA23332.1 cellulose biosynthesis regulator YedQ [Sporolactobacillus terrae]QAA26304.1 cellulose biosynthesis regulator YedQ [Sporolactobacillus terrae]UAK15396.1 GGDEF domain-containing protein [Sporolactobacillus terrae]